jgi:hypothetical protein
MTTRADPDSLQRELGGIRSELHALAGHLRAERAHLDEIETQLRRISDGDVQASPLHPEKT